MWLLGNDIQERFAASVVALRSESACEYQMLVARALHLIACGECWKCRRRQSRHFLQHAWSDPGLAVFFDAEQLLLITDNLYAVDFTDAPVIQRLLCLKRLYETS